jgi:hypothetical protein
MSETKNSTYDKIIKEIDEYLAGPFPVAKTVTITNVAFKEAFKVYGMLDKDRACLFLPGEIGYENVTVIYQASPIFKFIIHSEPCIDFRWKVRQLTFSKN